ncbi:MAG: hypothetical protein EZS28_042504 [Streblomastix strix]|uniref:Uncharacterized protein n=1 Tax=Streblomastix strix TaxID=222440 RepID=A0A5J4TVQ8_9EUKA|nr:MAG: hypothetical protein EZS28_042504 [Streblomastix strix]
MKAFIWRCWNAGDIQQTLKEQQLREEDDEEIISDDELVDAELQPYVQPDTITSEDLIPFTRRPLFIIADSNGSKSFSSLTRPNAAADRIRRKYDYNEYIEEDDDEQDEYGGVSQFGQPIVVLMSPTSPLRQQRRIQIRVISMFSPITKLQ